MARCALWSVVERFHNANPITLSLALWRCGVFRPTTHNATDADNNKDFSMSDFLVSTQMVPDECPRCKRGIWIGLVNGFETKVEPTPLNLSDEMNLRLREPNARIFQTFKSGKNFELQKRTAWHITKGDPKAIVLVAHDCNRLGESGIVVELYPQPKLQEGSF